ncbi:MAG: DUF4397 domain-containing protein [Terriglobales bacterium]|jgi:hypothetical protein
MTLRPRILLQLAALCLALGATSFAADNAYLYLVHGIPGRDIADNVNPGFPIDVLVDGNCLTRGLAFDSTSGPLTFAPGTYDVQISEANSLAGCSNPTITDSQVKITAGASVSVVAAISSGQAALLSFTDDFTSVTPGNARFDFAQAADAPTLQATLTQVGVKSPQTFTLTAAPGKQQEINVPAGTYLVQILAGDISVLASDEISLPNQSATFAYAIGQAANSSIALVTKTVRDVF